MNRDIAISVENLGKEYFIGHQKSGDLRSSFTERFKNLIGKNQEIESFWALKDINFEVKKGEAVGIIGKNGAGKSTLLKVLSRITEPTTGKFQINGRVSSLLEVGTGFHPELSGRENIFLNGTILGMKRTEIKAKFDEIVDFSGVSKFLDTPVKHYSSGMKVRLAFSVAAHLEPEILIVDEVLAVGDAEFQKKCLGKMNEVSKKEGRTVLFVSHNMGAITQLCTEGIHLKNGLTYYKGEINKTLESYLSNNDNSEYKYQNNSLQAENILINSVEIFTSMPDNNHTFGKPLKLEFKVYFPKSNNIAALSFQICDQLGTPIIHQWIFDKEQHFSTKIGMNSIICLLDNPKLYMGNYTLNVYLAEKTTDTNIKLVDICPFRIEMAEAREEFPWADGACKYIESSKWLINA
ncbi:MAG: lipopolysaccharide transport system ATP-binding protein [Psychroserpens sp.]